MEPLRRQLLHGLALTVAVLALAYYGLAVYTGLSLWLAHPDLGHAWLWRVHYLLQVIFVSGLPPALVAFYFLVWRREPRAWIAGLGLLVAFVMLHYVVLWVGAHAGLRVFGLLEAIETILAVSLIVVWQRQHRRRARA